MQLILINQILTRVCILFPLGKARLCWASVLSELEKGFNKGNMLILLQEFFCVLWYHDNLAIWFMEGVQHHQRHSIISVTSEKIILVTQQSFSRFIVGQCKFSWPGSPFIPVCLGQPQFIPISQPNYYSPLPLAWKSVRLEKESCSHAIIGRMTLSIVQKCENFCFLVKFSRSHR